LVDDGIPPTEIIAAVAVGAGLGTNLCKAASAVGKLMTVAAILREISFIGTAALALKVIIEWLKSGPIRNIPVINKWAIVLVLVLVLVQRAMGALEYVVKEWFFLVYLVDSLTEMCEYSGKYMDGEVNIIDELGEILEDKL